MPRKYGEFEISVAPERILYTHIQHEWPRFLRRWPRLVCPGNWDAYSQVYTPFRLPQVQQIFVEGMPYQQTRAYKKMYDQLGNKKRTGMRGAKTVADIDRYFTDLFKLYDSMRTHGYLPRDTTQERSRDKEITVRISRDGEILKCGEGTHRHALAILLGLPSVPVVVDLVHTTWARQQCAQHDMPVAQALQKELEELAR